MKKNRSWFIQLHARSRKRKTKLFAYPSRMHQIQGKPSKQCDITTIAEASTREGKIASLITMPLSLLRAVGSSPKPARIRIITRAIILHKNY
jgi:hypothetical protein